MPLEDFNERMGVEIPVDDSDTIGGFVFGLLGHQPEKGETTQWDGLDLRVEATDGKRIQKVCVIRTADTGLTMTAESSGANGAGRNGSRTPNPDEASQTYRTASMD